MEANLSKCFHNCWGCKFASAGIITCSVLRRDFNFDLGSGTIVHPSEGLERCETIFLRGDWNRLDGLHPYLRTY